MTSTDPTTDGSGRPLPAHLIAPGALEALARRGPDSAAARGIDALLEPATPDLVVRRSLELAVATARAHISTPADHALAPNHYADERVRDLLEEIIHRDR